MPITTRNGRRTYTVHGMTCDHCVRAVREEVGAVAGVTRVDVSSWPPAG